MSLCAIFSTTPYKISATPQIFEITTNTTFEFDKFDDFEYSLTYNNVTKNFVLTFVKPSGDVDSGCLRVIKRNQTNDYTICDVCETSSSATLYCNINAYGNGTYLADFYATGSFKWIDSLSQLIGISSTVYQELGNENGTIFAIVTAGVVLSFFLISPVLAVIGVLAGSLVAIAMGFQPMDYTAFLGIVVVGGIIVWMLKK